MKKKDIEKIHNKLTKLNKQGENMILIEQDDRLKRATSPQLRNKMIDDRLIGTRSLRRRNGEENDNFHHN